MDSQNPYAAPATDEQSRPEQPPEYYVPLESRAKWVSLTIVVSLVFGTLSMLIPATEATELIQTASEEEVPLSLGDSIEILYVVAALAVIVMLCFFLPQANRNARVLAQDIQFTPAATIWWFFVPIMNLIRPYQAVSELWNSSEPNTTVPWKFGVTPSILRIWWGAWIISTVFERMASKLGVGHGVSLFFDYIAGGALIVILRGLAQRQAQRKQALETAGHIPSAYSASVSR